MSSIAGPAPSARARREPVAPGRRSPSSSRRSETVNVFASRATSAPRRAGPSTSRRAPRSRVSREDEASIVACTAPWPSVSASRLPSTAAERTVSAPGGPSVSSRPRASRPRTRSVAELARDPGTIRRRPSAARHRSAARSSARRPRPAATSACAASFERATTRRPSRRTSSRPSTSWADRPGAFRASVSTIGPSDSRYAANGSLAPPPGPRRTSRTGCSTRTAVGRIAPTSAANVLPAPAIVRDRSVPARTTSATARTPSMSPPAGGRPHAGGRGRAWIARA